MEADIVEGRGLGGRPADSADRVWLVPAVHLRRMVAAGMLGASLFLIQAGAAELLLRSDRICREVRSANWAFNPQGCQPEVVRYFLQGLSRGFVGAVRPDLSAAGVLTMAAMMGILAAFLGLLRWRDFAAAFLLIEVLAALVFGLVGFLVLYLG